MEHLPVLDSHVKVFRYLGQGAVYDLGGFRDFPSRQGVPLTWLLSVSKDRFRPIETVSGTPLNTIEAVEASFRSGYTLVSSMSLFFTVASLWTFMISSLSMSRVVIGS